MTTPARHDALLLAAASGDDEALARLVQTYHHRVHRFGLRACRDRFDADDAVQEAFSRLALRVDVQRDPGVLSWLFTTVRNACLRLLRPFAREQRLGERADLDETPGPELAPDEMLERWRLVSQVHEAIARLPAPQREVLVLRDIEGLEGDEVARRLGLSEAAMKSRLHRARSAVRDELKSTEMSQKNGVE